MQAGPDSLAIKRFSKLLEDRACVYWLENELAAVLPSRKTRPDFFAQTANGIRLLVEVESFEKDRFALLALRQNRVMSGQSDSDDRRLCNAIQRASKQLKYYRDLGFPTLVVLDDFRQVGMPTNSEILGLSLLSYLEKGNKSHISSIAWLLGHSGGPFHLRIFHNPRSLVPLPMEVFHTQVDEHWYHSPGKFWKREVNGNGTY